MFKRIRTFMNDDAEVEYQLINFIYALVCVNIFVGGMWLLGIAP